MLSRPPKEDRLIRWELRADPTCRDRWMEKNPSGADSWTQPLWRGAHHASIPGVLAHVDFSKDKHMVVSLEALH